MGPPMPCLPVVRDASLKDDDGDSTVAPLKNSASYDK